MSDPVVSPALTFLYVVGSAFMRGESARQHIVIGNLVPGELPNTRTALCGVTAPDDTARWAVISTGHNSNARFEVHMCVTCEDIRRQLEFVAAEMPNAWRRIASYVRPIDPCEEHAGLAATNDALSFHAGQLEATFADYRDESRKQVALLREQISLLEQLNAELSRDARAHLTVARLHDDAQARVRQLERAISGYLEARDGASDRTKELRAVLPLVKRDTRRNEGLPEMEPAYATTRGNPSPSVTIGVGTGDGGVEYTSQQDRHAELEREIDPVLLLRPTQSQRMDYSNITPGESKETSVLYPAVKRWVEKRDPISRRLYQRTNPHGQLECVIAPGFKSHELAP